jgi:DNA-directed RNA polymerase specialized sigma24 family protein
MMRSVTPRLVAAVVRGDRYITDDPEWSSSDAQAIAQRIIENVNLASAGVGYKQYLLDRYADNLSFEEIAAKHGHNREKARQRVAKALRLARGKLKSHIQALRATIKEEER